MEDSPGKIKLLLAFLITLLVFTPSCVISGGKPEPRVERPRTSPFNTGAQFTITPPLWLSSADYPELERVVLEYVRLYEELFEIEIPLKGLDVIIVNQPYIIAKGTLHTAGWGVYDGIFYRDNITQRRKLFVVWERIAENYPEPRSENPLPAFLHELNHDRQLRLKGSMTEEFSDLETHFCDKDNFTSHIKFNFAF